MTRFDLRATDLRSILFATFPRGPHLDRVFPRPACAERELPVFVHAPYLINFGSPSTETLAKSRRALEFSLRRGAAVGARGVVVHAGSAVLGNRWEQAVDQVRAEVLPLLREDWPRLLIEPTAGGGGALAADVDSTVAYLDALDDERVGLCLDTCHVHASGHDMSTGSGVAGSAWCTSTTAATLAVRSAIGTRRSAPALSASTR